MDDLLGEYLERWCLDKENENACVSLLHQHDDHLSLMDLVLEREDAEFYAEFQTIITDNEP